jgi:hypothetical protein
MAAVKTLLLGPTVDFPLSFIKFTSIASGILPYLSQCRNVGIIEVLKEEEEEKKK